jgi:hypothetical protein
MNEIGKDVYENFTPVYSKDDSGWNGDKHSIKEFVKNIKPSVIIEVGTWKGFSAFNMCNVIREEKLNTKIYCVDTWLGSLEFWHNYSDTNKTLDLYLKNGYPQVYYQFLSNVVHHGVQDIIVPVPATSTTGAKILEHMNIQAELIYIDGSHETEDVYNDIKAYWPLLREGGIMFGDDWAWDKVKAAIWKYSGDNEKFYWTTEDDFWYMKK